MTNEKKQNIDPEEIAKFSEFAAHWWDLQGEMKPLHQINPLRLDYIERHADLNNQLVLDVGCGGGILSEALAKAGAIVTGIDMSNAALNVAKKHAEENHLKIQYEHSAVEDYAVKHPEKFDVVTCMELLEHVPDPQSVVNACADLTKPGGFIFFSTINRNVKSFLYAVVAAEYILKLLPKGTHSYEKFIRPSELTLWATRKNLQLGGLQGMQYHPFDGSYSLGKNVDVNYLIYFKK